MDNLVITKQFLIDMLSADDNTIESYYKYASEGRIEATERLAVVSFLMELIVLKTRKMIDAQSVNPFHFFGVPQDQYIQHADLLKRTDFEIGNCLKENVCLPDRALVDFGTDYAFFLFWQGSYFDCLAKCQNVLDRDPNNFLCNFIKAAIVEMCLINKTSDEYKVALVNYQKSLISKCDNKDICINEDIFITVLKIINGRYNIFPEEAKAICFDLVPNYLEDAKKAFPNWTEEHHFYMKHHLFLNPLCDFGNFAQATLEQMLPLPIDSEYQSMFDELVQDYKLCRATTYAYYAGINNIGKREMCMVYCYAYSVFDKLAYLLAKIYRLDIAEECISFTTTKLFDSKIENQEIRFRDIKNINIYPLFGIARAARTKNKTQNSIQTGTFEINELRNQIDHKSLHLVEEKRLRRNSIILLQLARRGILHTYLLLNGFSKNRDDYVSPSAYSTTYIQALAELTVKKHD